MEIGGVDSADFGCAFFLSAGSLVISDLRRELSSRKRNDDKVREKSKKIMRRRLVFFNLI
jgi:hypothetical protein